ncbi:MAG: phage Gp37/Gp68 family protein [Ignavibacteria bacterium]|jgi:protein gp37
MSKSKIEWTEVTWNPATGCNKVSPGCKYCYAEVFAKRLQGMGVNKYENGFELTLQPDVLNLPKRWRGNKTVFVNSMSDLFHENIPFEYIKKVFNVMHECPQHTFQVLTKRSERLSKMANKLTWTPNIWMGVSVENEDYTFRIDQLRKIPSKIKFLSLEPLLGPLPDLNLKNIDWVIVGGESGKKARPMRSEWVLDIQKQCGAKKVLFFFKQWGGMNKKLTGRELNGRTYDDMPRRAKNDMELFQNI